LAARRPTGLQKINVKLFAEAPASFDADVLLAIFGRWRLIEGEEIVDLADYAHVDRGPGCLLISHRWHFGIDLAEGAPGFFYSTRSGLEGTLAERICQAMRGLLEKTARLVAEPDFPADVRPRLHDLEVVFNDRLLLPNTDASDAEARPGLAQALERIHGPGPVRLEREKDPLRRLGYRVKVERTGSSSVETLLGRLTGAGAAG
jgi:hypothetical protein